MASGEPWSLSLSMVIAMVGLGAWPVPVPGDGGAKYRVDEVLDIAPAIADFRVGFGLLTGEDRQYVAFYNAERQMTIASRGLDARDWQYQALPSRVGWDSHNYITMAIDRDGHLHVSGNMHVDPLVYFRTERPGDITSLAAAGMTGELEGRVTYPHFLQNKDGDLVYHYRDGASGAGRRIYNAYDPDTRTWSRLLDTPLFEGEGKRNAYPLGPVRGPDGLFHIVWVWRTTPDCATNHHLSYTRSADLVHWESAFGERVQLPIRIEQEALLVDPIPINGGIINGCERLIFDASGRPIIFYHKSDEQGHMQVYAARPEDGAWKIRALTDWSEPVPFSGWGSMGFIGISLGEVIRVRPGLWSLSYRHKDHGTGRLFIDEATLQLSDERVDVIPEYPSEMHRVESDIPGMGVRRADDLGTAEEPGVRYVLQWESLGSNHDRRPEPPLPDPSMLRLYRLVSVE